MLVDSVVEIDYSFHLAPVYDSQSVSCLVILKAKWQLGPREKKSDNNAIVKWNLKDKTNKIISRDNQLSFYSIIRNLEINLEYFGSYTYYFPSIVNKSTFGRWTSSLSSTFKVFEVSRLSD